MANASTAGRNSLREIDDAVGTVNHDRVYRFSEKGKAYKVPAGTTKPQEFKYISGGVERTYERAGTEISRYETFDVVDINGEAVRLKSKDMINLRGPKDFQDVFGEAEIKGNALEIKLHFFGGNGHSAYKKLDLSQLEEIKGLPIVNIKLEPNGQRIHLISISNDNTLTEHTYDLNRLETADTKTRSLDLRHAGHKSLDADEVKRLGIFEASLKVLKPRKATSETSRGVKLKTVR